MKKKSQNKKSKTKSINSAVIFEVFMVIYLCGKDRTFLQRSVGDKATEKGFQSIGGCLRSLKCDLSEEQREMIKNV